MTTALAATDDPSEPIRFSRQERSRLSAPATPKLALDVSMMCAQIAVGIAVFASHPSFWSWVVAAFLIGGGQHGLTMVAHEAVHTLVWPQSRRVNDWLGGYLFAGPTLLPYGVYRERHLAHHRFVSTANDTKSLYRRDLAGWRFVTEALRSLSGRDYIVQVLDVLRRGREDAGRNSSADFENAFPRDALRIGIVQAALFMAFLPFDPRWHGIPTYYLLLWLAPIMTTLFWFSKLRSCVEHRPLRSEAGTHEAFFMGTSAPMLRSVRATWFERLFFSKINFHYHGEHHLWPWISYQHLPEASTRLRASGAQTGPRGQTASDGGSYLATIAQFVFDR
jgi:fatty acid desaturase